MTTTATSAVTDDVDHSADSIGTYRSTLDNIAPPTLARIREALTTSLGAGYRPATDTSVRRSPAPRDSRRAAGRLVRVIHAHR
jgi:hypothetical protein